eukprot:CAMPEP_0184362278 /NCGR_PEP_ID=MMETSP1089-20130417/134038_1 /TAXON_ID=38269 ORGANISM="Gloeochaete wittrockiana, Strain SAG46.84" /NCGR_SAMPLE_ID=MMETSP1089 /ASSEMBLY_ACC=CAM_ASM_000445 /LENGTH=447 /DNA_ID=CAMNT_0026702291 /DNA_START=83 /DNA_END=1426 /DNA_ORIENTATION=-
MAVIAKNCPTYKVTVVDIDAPRIAAWNSDNLPIFEPLLKETIVEAKTKNNNLFFSTDVTGAIKECEIIFISVNTPTKLYGRGAGKSFDMTAWEAVSRSVAAAAETDKIIVEKSTVPLGTAEKVNTILEANKRHNVKFQIVSNPEFLAEGSAIRDLEDPMRVLVGGNRTPEGEVAISKIVDIYRHWVAEEKIITTNLWTSELSKLASNALLAQRISSINAFSAICEESGADITEVSRVLGMDGRIGHRYLSASVGFGGSCLKKDVMALVYIAESYQLYQVAEYFKAIVDINEFQKERFSVRILETMYGTVRNKKLAVLGFAFKKDTGDTRETSAVSIIRFLLDEGAKVHVYDPKVPHHEIVDFFPKDHNLSISNTHEEAVKDAHAIIVITEWDEFKNYDYVSIFQQMPKPAFIFDGRNILDHDRLEEIGFHVHAIGKKSHQEQTHVVL